MEQKSKLSKSFKQRVIQILYESFKDNKSTNYIIKQGQSRDRRLRTLIKYSIFYGEKFGEVYLSDDESSCYILMESELKKTTLKSVFWDVKLIIQCIGITNVRKVLKRESIIKSYQPKGNFIHLWYIGVSPNQQGEGRGTMLMKEIIHKSREQNKTLCLETSTERNFQFYERLGFKEKTTLHELSYSLKMYFLK